MVVKGGSMKAQGQITAPQFTQEQFETMGGSYGHIPHRAIAFYGCGQGKGADRFIPAYHPNQIIRPGIVINPLEVAASSHYYCHVDHFVLSRGYIVAVCVNDGAVENDEDLDGMARELCDRRESLGLPKEYSYFGES